MEHASPMVYLADSDDDEYVEIDQEDMTVGLQQVAAPPVVQQQGRSASAFSFSSSRASPFAPSDDQQAAPASGFGSGFGASSSTQGFGGSQQRASGFSFGLKRDSSTSSFDGWNPQRGSNLRGGFERSSNFAGCSDTSPWPQARGAWQQTNTTSSFWGQPRTDGAWEGGFPTSRTNSSFSHEEPAWVSPFGHADHSWASTFGRNSTGFPTPPSASGPEILRRRRRKRKGGPKLSRQKVNTNIVSVKLGTLGQAASQIATGDAVFCQNGKCRTVLTSLSEVMTENESDLKLDEAECFWTCQFCGTRNVCDLEEEEKPKGESQDYMLEPPNHNANQEDDSIVVFCVDVSGSMCVSQELDGRIEMKGNRLAKMQTLNDDGSNQYLSRQRRNTTFVSRLQCVQAAIDDQLAELAKTKPQQKVALVSFSDEVTIFGDGTEGVAQIVAGDKLDDAAECLRVGSQYRVASSVAEAREQLSTALWNLEENGQTALGPALVVSIALAAQQPGSRVVLCTDGLANIGVGSLEVDDDGDMDLANNVTQWYDNIGTEALNSGVAVSIVSIADDGCNLENLGKVADLSCGEVCRIDPLELTKNFQGIMSKPVLATHVQARMFIHPGLKFRGGERDRWSGFGADGERPSKRQRFDVAEPRTGASPVKSQEMAIDSITDDSACLAAAISDTSTQIAQETQDVGNVFEDSTVFFEYEVVKERISEYQGLDGLPFQVQISYTRLDGAKMMRVITQLKPITTRREEALANMNFEVISSNAQRKTGRLCQDGDYASARVNTFKTAVWMSSHAQNQSQERHVNPYVQRNLQFDGMMQAQQQQEFASGSGGFGSVSSSQMQARQGSRNDAFSSAMFGSKSTR